MVERTHYEILGVASTASLDDIKRKYRELARKYHPDVSADKQTAARVFSRVTEAYKVLSDPASRGTYDAELALRARQAERATAAPRPAASPNRPAPAAGATPRAGAGAPLQESDRLVRLAQAAFGKNKLVEARSLAEQALRFHPRNARAYEVLGDICRVQQRTDDALTHYTMVLQIDPRNAAVRQRLERMARAAPAPVSMPRPRPAASSPPRSATHSLGDVPAEKRHLARLLVGVLGYAGAMLLVLYSALMLDHSRPANALPIPVVSYWSWSLIAVMGTCGALLGTTLAVTGSIRRIEDELILTSSGARGAPLGLFILVIGALNFWVAAAMHLVLAWTQESLTASLGRLYGAVTLATGLLALTAAGGWLQTLAFGGNVVFLAAVVGWFLGDFFRAD